MYYSQKGKRTWIRIGTVYISRALLRFLSPQDPTESITPVRVRAAPRLPAYAHPLTPALSQSATQSPRSRLSRVQGLVIKASHTRLYNAHIFFPVHVRAGVCRLGRMLIVYILSASVQSPHHPTFRPTNPRSLLFPLSHPLCTTFPSTAPLYPHNARQGIRQRLCSRRQTQILP